MSRFSIRRTSLFVVSAALASILLQAGPSGWAPAADAPLSDEARLAMKEKLAEFNDLIGGWRGVGMPQRGSRKGNWGETARWKWDFSKNGVALWYDIKDSKLMTSARLTYDLKDGVYKLHGVFADKTERDYTGKLQKPERGDGPDLLVLESQPDQDGYVYRITVTRLNEKRTLVLHEKRRSAQSFFFRIAEVGYTRKGTSLAGPGSTGPECIVTGGGADIKVTYQGKTYYVCCSGCKQAFDDDPAGIIAEAAERRQREL